MDKIEEKTENQEVATQQPGHRDKVMERLRARHADKTFDNDEDLYSAINDDYDEDSRLLDEYKARDEKMKNMFKTDGYSAAFFSSWRKGKDPIAELIRQYGPDFKEALDNPDKLDEFAAANKEYADRMAESNKFEDEYKININASLDAMDELQKAERLSDDQINLAWTTLVEQAQSIMMGKITPDMIKQMLAAINHDIDVSDAAEEGRIAGRNEKITEKLRKRNDSDGTANMSGGVGKKVIKAANYEDQSDIYKRGGEKKSRGY